MGHLRWIRRERRWSWALALIATACCLVTTAVFSPGFVSADTLSQLRQALGREPLSDWHPPVMSLVWQGLIAVTGLPAALAIVQSVLFWAALGTIAWCVWEATGSRPKSLAVLGVGLTPQVLTFVGVVWKDVHMAIALLATCAVALVGRRLPAGRSALRWALLWLGVLFLVYAILVRKNAVFAAIPVFVLLVLALWGGRPGRRTWLMSTAALVVALVLPSAAVSAFARPVQLSQGSQILLDDLIHVVPVRELRTADVSLELRGRLVAAAEECHRIKSLSNSYFTCYDPGPNGLAADADQLTSLWISKMSGDVPLYLQYRLQVFSELLFKGRYEYQNGVMPNDLGLRVTNPRLEATLQNYIDAAVRDLSFLFAGWFWLGIGLVLVFRPGRGSFSMPVRALAFSSVAYVVGYLPIMPATDFRYIYWPAIAGTLGLLLVWVGRGAPPPASPTGSRTGDDRREEPYRSADSENEPLPN
ncbi:hypothetical protein [Streptomyces sp. NPDC048248]|uniref:hypothetical protein n=1 Tax=Streptomyces sp. NPDC048248 TaxID=3365523 RepID=UPI00371BF3BC